MKRILNLFFALVICFSFAACTDSENEKYIIDVRKSDNSMLITVAVPYIDGMQYVNIFRKDNEKDVFNVAQIIPAIKNKNTTYLFEDRLVLDGHEYQYMARFRVNGLYKTTDWSDKVEISQESPIYESGDPKPVLSSEDCYFSCDEKAGTLTLVAESENETCSIDLPTESDFSEFNLGLAISNGKSASVFRLASAGAAYTTDSSPALLRSILSSEYFDRTITLKGVVCQLVSKTYQTLGDEETPLRYTTVQWTAPLELRVKIEDEVVPSFKVNLKTSDEENYDFTDVETSKSLNIKPENSCSSFFVLDY